LYHFGGDPLIRAGVRGVGAGVPGVGKSAPKMAVFASQVVGCWAKNGLVLADTSGAGASWMFRQTLAPRLSIDQPVENLLGRQGCVHLVART
jgi:hypothetical protein